MEADILEASNRAREEGRAFAKKRFPYAKVKKFAAERVFLGLVGPRGVGKTVLLKQLAFELQNTLYVSLDDANLKTDLYDFAKQASEAGISVLLLDEIHVQPNFHRELKRIYDSLKLQVIFTSSSSISLHESAFDLSRRVRLVEIAPMSLRELVWFRKGTELPALDFEDLASEKKCREYYSKTLAYEPLFDELLKGAAYPFTEGKTEPLQLFGNVLRTIISRDALLVADIGPKNIPELEKLVAFVGNAPAEDVNYSSISTALGITKYYAEKYVSILEKAFVLRRVFPKGTSVLKEPKILMSLPYRLLYRKYEDCIGALREDFFVEAMAYAGKKPNYLKTTRGRKTPDYLIGNTVYEIGGKGKGREQFKNVDYENKIILCHPGRLDEIRRPLFFAGLLG